MQRLVVVAVLLTAGVLYGEPIVRRWNPGVSSHTTIAQRYPLRTRSKNFYDRSKISNSASVKPKR